MPRALVGDAAILCSNAKLARVTAIPVQTAKATLFVETTTVDLIFQLERIAAQKKLKKVYGITH